MDNSNEQIDLTKSCSRCGNISLKRNFPKNISSKDGLNPSWKNCRRNYHKKKFSKNKKVLFRKSR